MSKKYCIVIIVFFALHIALMHNCYATDSINFYLGKPYLANPLGEGENAPYAKGPLFREDAFDCTTYVEAMLMQLNRGIDEANFHKKLMHLRYVDGVVSFFTRAHLMEYQWIPNALKYNIISNYPLQNTKNSVVKLHFREWFFKNKFIQHKDQAYFESASKQPEYIESSIKYVPSQVITSDFLQALPKVMVVFFIKEIAPNSWPGQKERQELVTHMGILKGGQLYHASIRKKQVVQVGLLDYLAKAPFLGVSFYSLGD